MMARINRTNIAACERAYDEGVKAKLRGEPRDSNPHEIGTDERRWWKWGWDNAYRSKGDEADYFYLD